MSAQHDRYEDSDSESGSSDSGTASEDVASWISWFCSLKGNEFFCEVEEDFIQDDFNLSGLSTQVPYYDYALDLILDSEPSTNEILTEEQHELVESAAEVLYGLIHVRFVLTARGMQAMLEKYHNNEFGRCPRVLCNGQACLPVGTSDIPRQSTVKAYCPKCEDIFYPRNKYQTNIDGAYFGTTFPHLLLMTHAPDRPSKAEHSYVPRVFGFKLHRPDEANSNHRPSSAAGVRPSSNQRHSNAAGPSSSRAAAASSAPQDMTDDEMPQQTEPLNPVYQAEVH